MRTLISNALVNLALLVQPRKPIACNITIEGTMDILSEGGLVSGVHLMSSF